MYHDYEVYANVETGNSRDINRLSARASSSHFDSNRGWGLGTMYDYTAIDTGVPVCGPDGSKTARPQCDAQYHVEVQHWGSGGGLGGMIGTDNVCKSNCPWTKKSGDTFHYAIFVAE